MIKAKYTAAIETHKHYDTISLALVTGMIAISGLAFSLYETVKHYCLAPYVFIISALLVFILYLMYRKCSEYAQVARNVARYLEKGEEDDAKGISYVLYYMHYGSAEDQQSLKNKFGRIKLPSLCSVSLFRLIFYLEILLTTIMLFAFFNFVDKSFLSAHCVYGLMSLLCH